MVSKNTSVVTGAFGYSGRYIARRLLDAGAEVRTLTNAPDSQSPFGSRVRAMPFSFDDHARLVEALRGASVLYNTYWVRFNHTKFRQADAVRNTLSLFRAAREACVQRVVHLSITNPSEDSPLEYFRSKATLEKALMDSGLSYSILRPTVLFGREDVLVNNIAWLLRRFPFSECSETARTACNPCMWTTWPSSPWRKACEPKIASLMPSGRRPSPTENLSYR